MPATFINLTADHITYFDLISIKTDKRVIKEYERLLEENRTKLQKYLIDI